MNDPKLDVDDILIDPIKIINNYKQIRNPQIPLPSEIFLPERENSKGYDLDNEYSRERFISIFDNGDKDYKACSIINNKNEIGFDLVNVLNPANLKKVVGKVSFANEKIIKESIINASSFYSTWKNTTVEARILIIKM